MWHQPTSGAHELNTHPTHLQHTFLASQLKTSGNISLPMSYLALNKNLDHKVLR